jgi:hypothetical protein
VTLAECKVGMRVSWLSLAGVRHEGVVVAAIPADEAAPSEVKLARANLLRYQRVDAETGGPRRWASAIVWCDGKRGNGKKLRRPKVEWLAAVMP